jgi:hypothetical protein
MLKVKRPNTRGISIAIALSLFITLSAVAGYIYALEKPGSPTLDKWVSLILFFLFFLGGFFLTS